MADVGDKITDTRNAARPNTARVSSGRTAAGTTLSCDSLAGWPTASKVHGVTYQIDSSSNPVAGTQLDFYAIRSGNDLTSFTVVDGTDIGNSINDVVEMLPTAAWGQDLADALTSQHSRTGAHTAISNTGGLTTDTLTASGAATLSGGTILPAGDIATADLADSAVTFAKVAAGFPVQVVQTDSAAGTTGTTILPVDATIPQNTEGFEVMTQTITPKSDTSSLLIEFEIMASGSTTIVLSAAIFRDSTAGAIFATTEYQSQSGGDQCLSGSVKVAASSVSATTFKVRIGASGAATVTFGGGRFGGIPHSFIRVTEIKG